MIWHFFWNSYLFLLFPGLLPAFVLSALLLVEHCGEMVDAVELDPYPLLSTFRVAY